MKRIYALIINLFFTTCAFVIAQDTIDYPLKIKAGLDIAGPVIYFTDKSNLSLEGYLSVDINPKTAMVLAAGYLDYKFSQYNYEYKSKGIFVRAGPDFNLRKPELSSDRYYAGIGLRYGLSIFNSETPLFQETNYWGTTTSSISPVRSAAHFLEVTPGIKSEVFKNLSIGWSVSLRLLLYSGSNKDLRPIYIPGFGNSAKTISTGINYYIVWNIPYKKVRHFIKPETIPDDENMEPTISNPNQSSTGIRQ
jgi:hypothetical protein